MHPLSPILFCLAEDLASRGLTKMVNDYVWSYDVFS